MLNIKQVFSNTPIAFRTRSKMQQKSQTSNKLNLKDLENVPPNAIETEQNYNFEMLQEDDDDDSDDEKMGAKYPPPPKWSINPYCRFKIIAQEHLSEDTIDCFFSVEPTTFNLQTVFPNIKKRHLVRRSSVFWKTPPRYSELPKY